MVESFTAALIVLGVFAGLLLIWFAYRVGVKSGGYSKDLEWQQNLVRIRKDVADRQRVGIKGKVTEAFAPFLKGFPFKASECKFIGDPIDYLVFEGLDERNVKSVHFVEVKSDKSKMSKHQKQIKDIIDSANTDKISFHNFNFKSEDEF
jgi:predicted Holliday junction resolvase-like endonuclease